MAHFGLLSYKGTGHLNPLISLSRQLIARGHKVTLFQSPELELRAREQGLDFFPIETSHSADIKQHRTRKPTSSASLVEIRYRLHRISSEMETFLHAYPPALRATGVDTLIMGEISLTGPTVAELLRLPYFIVSTSIPHNFGWHAPRSILSTTSWTEGLQKKLLEVSVLHMNGPVLWSLDRLRKRVGLASARNIAKTHPELAHITQWPQCLDDQRFTLPTNFFYTGPFVNDMARPSIDFPWEKLDGRPLVYASLGTTRKNDASIFHRIAQACSGLGMQLVITLGGRRDPSILGGLPGDPVVVGNAPQLELLKSAAIVITHAGPNTVLETLLHGKPMVALPMTLDQPAVAARLAKAGAAVVLSEQYRSVKDIRDALLKVRDDPRYHEASIKLQTQMLPLRGLERAAEIIEQSLASHHRSVPPAQDLPFTDTQTAIHNVLERETANLSLA
ncbi:glycosyltransferase [Granulicella sp. L46]|uniref:glycosyltransferase n=1 Tax=Granulicella sp. L46 TaxID=1641865 RepID=UPI00131BDB18|nr:nucleotide disphospho-sugar-binding domain-containing protein [Granulicella sp. L46]